MQDIPKGFTAMAEWLSCILFIIQYRRFLKKNIYIGAVISFVTIAVLQYFCGKVSNVLWLAGMLCAFLTMFFLLHHSLQLPGKTLFYVCIRSFLLAEFVAAFEWQIYSYYFIEFEKHNVTRAVLFCMVTYAVLFFLYFLIESHSMPENYDNRIYHEQFEFCLCKDTIFREQYRRNI